MRALQQVLRALECNLVQQTPNGYQTVLQCSHMAYCTRVGVRGLHGQAPVYSSSCSSTSLVPSLQHTQPWHGWRTYKTAYERSTARSRQKIVDNGMYLGAVVLGMIGLSYASVPLYRMFCQATGYGGAVGRSNIEDKVQKWQQAAGTDLEKRAAQRELRVWFSGDVAEDLPWKFTPAQDFVTVHPGQSTLAFFTAENRSDKAITGVSTYNVTPDKAAYYFNKIQCFCFEEQRLQPREVVDMPVFFYIDPELVDDFNCRNIHDITLAYTFFKTEEEEEEAAAAADSRPSGVRLHGPGVLPAGLGATVPQAQTAAVAVAAAAPVAPPAATGTPATAR